MFRYGCGERSEESGEVKKNSFKSQISNFVIRPSASVSQVIRKETMITHFGLRSSSFFRHSCFIIRHDMSSFHSSPRKSFGKNSPQKTSFPPRKPPLFETRFRKTPKTRGKLL